jgi:hypothetical protein
MPLKPASSSRLWSLESIGEGGEGSGGDAGINDITCRFEVYPK